MCSFFTCNLLFYVLFTFASCNLTLVIYNFMLVNCWGLYHKCYYWHKFFTCKFFFTLVSCYSLLVICCSVLWSLLFYICKFCMGSCRWLSKEVRWAFSCLLLWYLILSFFPTLPLEWGVCPTVVETCLILSRWGKFVFGSLSCVGEKLGGGGGRVGSFLSRGVGLKFF